MASTLNASTLLAVPLAPLAGAILAGVFGTTFGGNVIGRRLSHTLTILGVFIAFVLSAITLKSVAIDGARFNQTIYEWMVAGGLKMEVGFLVDGLTAMMMCVVTFVSLMVHIYTIGYMEEDEGYNRFFSYISLFTFSMLMLVMSNNFMQLFFGWEAVGVVSYLLIGFWYKRPTAIFANLKAFLVNRVGDFGFVLGIAAVVYYTAQLGGASLDYVDAFKAAPQIAGHTFTLPGTDGVNAMTLICICLLARMSPLFEFSAYALNFVLFIGATTALFMGFLGIISNDIKRVVAYSTLSQLGYMTVALGASAYSFGIFQLMTHAFFKALLFLAAGSVIICMHHEQDMRKMGGLFKHMKITAITCWIGTLALIGTPFFSGYYSKDLIIDAVHHQHELHPDNAIATYAYWCVMIGVFVTAFYSFRLLFMTFHGKPRWEESDAHASHAHADAGHVAHDDHAGHDHAHHDHAHGDHAHDDHAH